ncbi:MAG: ABC-F family ATP-binding cassette domain-containing protein [Pseudomonadota bacterium]
MSKSPPLLQTESLSLSFGTQDILRDASFSIRPGDRIALIGRNGSGKSTLLRLLAGQHEPDRGSITATRGTTLGYLPQSPDFSGHDTISGYLEADLSEFDDVNKSIAVLDEFGMDLSADPATLSGGEQRRIVIAKTLGLEPDILLLDEPTNHLDLPMIEWLESFLRRTRSAFLLISHDRRFLENTTNTCLWLDRGQLLRHDQGFAKFDGWREKLLEEEERDHHKLKRKIVREEHWVTHGVSGRRKRNIRRLGELAKLREAYRDREAPQGAAKITSGDGEKSGKLVIEAKGLSKAFGDRHLVRDFSLRINRGDRVAIVGPNGSGKTTLVNMLLGTLAPDGGAIRIGANVEHAKLDQRRDQFADDQSVEEYLTDGRGQTLLVNGVQRHVTAYLKDFVFNPEQARMPVSELSGGEKARLILAKLMTKPSNLLVLDEPTNDLDMETLDVLQELVADYDGTVLLVSHDRDFIDRTATATIAPDVERPGHWMTYAGGYADMVAQRGHTDKAKRAKETSKKGDAPKAEKPKSGSKLSYKVKYALETLPGEIDALNGDIEKLSAELSDPKLFTSDPDTFSRLSKALTEKQETLAAKEEEWLQAEMAREQALAQTA